MLSSLVFFPISTDFTPPSKIPSIPTVLQLDALRLIIPDNACILCFIAVAGTELADAYSSDTVIASSPRKEVHDPWAFYLHATLLRQAFAHCGKFSTAASCRSLGHVSVPVWLIILLDQLLIIALCHLQGMNIQGIPSRRDLGYGTRISYETDLGKNWCRSSWWLWADVSRGWELLICGHASRLLPPPGDEHSSYEADLGKNWCRSSWWLWADVSRGWELLICGHASRAHGSM
ncbi:hypothetical protein ZIOFF_062803 [Zingiber officinale]|uniref:Uncharacterized protein n=1 Tax=Zingiber officinale TaxID=94328 RepID=A0A8J5F2J1_ZINOF|nr:hypothetical protein ZIOFF_062803 [Zingiber officinale]